MILRVIAGTNITISSTGVDSGTGDVTINSTAAGGGAVVVQDEGTTLTSAVSQINFVGTGVTATTSGSQVTVTVPSGGSPGGSSGQIQVNNAGAFGAATADQLQVADNMNGMIASRYLVMN